jgi:ABC-type sugar transport system ATPase subunit
MSFLEIRQLSKSYPDGWSLAEVSFVVEEGEVLCLLGPSGCGKTTLLRLIAGLETPDDGQILLAGRDVTFIPPHRRSFGLMFQEYALFPHRDVFGNVAFGLRMAGWGRGRVWQRAREVLELVDLGGFEHRDVNQLSGGERQRVALARSLAPRPRLLMLDEPLGALDRTLRERLLEELPAILKRVGVTTITVTHDQEEAFAIADRVVVMRAGRVVQQGTPEEVYRHPASSGADQSARRRGRRMRAGRDGVGQVARGGSEARALGRRAWRSTAGATGGSPAGRRGTQPGEWRGGRAGFPGQPLPAGYPVPGWAGTDFRVADGRADTESRGASGTSA